VIDSDPGVITTARLLVRLPRETDRRRFVELFCNPEFMVFYPGVITEVEAEDRFDDMVAVCRSIPFGKQPVVELGLSWDTPASATSTWMARLGWNGDTG
jgi:hypothetical protein